MPTAMHTTGRAAGLASLLVALWAVGPVARGQDRAEDKANLVKAGLLVEFARYTTWPKGKFAKPDGPIVIGVIGDDDLAAALAGELRREPVKIQGRPVESRRVEPVDPEDRDQARRLLEEAQSLHVLYVGGTDRRWAEGIMERLEGQAVLTVSQIPRFVDAGGMIGLFIEKSYFRFDVNKRAIESAGMKISSKVLELARRVIR